MSTMKNSVQLVGNVGQDPEIRNLEGGKKVVNFSIATSDSYKNEKGEKVDQTEWHRIVAWGNSAEIIEKYVVKGNQIGIVGKLTHRTYDDKDGIKRSITEVLVSEVLLMSKN
jgi:single-strand DNA-binding protein